MIWISRAFSRASWRMKLHICSICRWLRELIVGDLTHCETSRNLDRFLKKGLNYLSKVNGLPDYTEGLLITCYLHRHLEPSMTSSIRVKGRFPPPNAITYQECGSFLAGPPVGLYDPPSFFGFQAPKHDHTLRVRPDANFLSRTLRFDDRPTLEKRSDVDYRAVRDPKSRSRTPGGGYHAPSSTRLL